MLPTIWTDNKQVTCNHGRRDGQLQGQYKLHAEKSLKDVFDHENKTKSSVSLREYCRGAANV